MRMKRYSKNDTGEFVLDESGIFMICHTKDLPEEFKDSLRKKYEVTESDDLFIVKTYNAEQRHRINRYLRRA